MLIFGLRHRSSRSACRVTISRLPEELPTEMELERRVRAVERRERQLDQALAALASQREQLAAIQAEYERRREGLLERTREVEAERQRLRAERAEVVAHSLSAEPRSTLSGAGR
jgi:flagellar motility protein MotE (MotC chaperone)